VPDRTASSPVRGVVPGLSSSLSNPDYCRIQSNSCYMTTVLYYLQEYDRASFSRAHQRVVMDREATWT
jgi:hypothetical protein